MQELKTTNDANGDKRANKQRFQLGTNGVQPAGSYPDQEEVLTRLVKQGEAS